MSSDSSSTTKNAIVEYREQPDAPAEYRALYCVESPEVRFDDYLTVELAGPVTKIPIDPVYAFVCEPGSIGVYGCATERAVMAGARVEGGDLCVVEVAGDVNFPMMAKLHLSGVRRGHPERFERKTWAEMEQNNAFWSKAQRAT